MTFIKLFLLIINDHPCIAFLPPSRFNSSSSCSLLIMNFTPSSVMFPICFAASLLFAFGLFLKKSNTVFWIVVNSFWVVFLLFGTVFFILLGSAPYYCLKQIGRFFIYEIYAYVFSHYTYYAGAKTTIDHGL